MSDRLYSLLYTLWNNKFAVWGTQIDRLTDQRIVSTPGFSATIAKVGSNQTLNDSTISTWGGCQFLKAYTTKSSNYGTGNITNVNTAKVTYNNTGSNGDTIAAHYYNPVISGVNGGLKSHYLDAAGLFYTNAVDTADAYSDIRVVQIMLYSSIL